MPEGIEASLIGQTLGACRVLGKLGAGGMGVVYQAFDEKLHRTVALKFLPPEVDSDERARELFLKEARAASALDHPNVGTVHGIEETASGGLFIVMAYYEGETLAQKIRGGPMPLSEAILIALQVARGLSEAHSHSVVHRDIKPSKIILTSQGVAKIVDFGLARGVQSISTTHTAEISGTAAYMSPEQALGKPLDGRTDLWSLGIVLYQMLTGRTPFTAESAPQLLYNIVNSLPADCEKAPPEVPKVVYRALAKDPALRYPNAQAMLEDLEQIRVMDANALASSIPAGELRTYVENASALGIAATPRKSGRRTWILAPAAVAVLLIAALFVPSVRTRVSTLLFRPSEKHIAVLPFTSAGDSGSAALADGLMDSLTARLSNLEVGSQSLWVVPAGEVRRLKISDAAAAGKELGANLVVTGTIQRDGQTIRLIVNLIDAASRRQLGSGEFQDRTGDFSLVKDSAVTKLANLLDIPLTRDMLRNTGGSVQPVAYESYLKGMGYLQRYDKPGNLDQAISSFQSAIDTDPKFALAFASLGEAFLLKYKTDQNVQWIDQASANC